MTTHPYALGVLGTGHIAQIIVRRLIDCGYLAKERIIVSPSKKLAKHPLRVKVATDNAEVVRDAKVVMLSVTPQKLAAKTDELILIHTPHLEDKYKGTRMILDMLRNEPRIKPGRVCVDHVEEHTIEHVLDSGYWAGMTLYPVTKCSPQRAADMVEIYGSDRLMVNSAGDWGPSNPMAVPQFIQEMMLRGHSDAGISSVVYQNPLAFFRQCRRFVSTRNL